MVMTPTTAGSLQIQLISGTKETLLHMPSVHPLIGMTYMPQAVLAMRRESPTRNMPTDMQRESSKLGPLLDHDLPHGKECDPRHHQDHRSHQDHACQDRVPELGIQGLVLPIHPLLLHRHRQLRHKALVSLRGQRLLPIPAAPRTRKLTLLVLVVSSIQINDAGVLQTGANLVGVPQLAGTYPSRHPNRSNLPMHIRSGIHKHHLQSHQQWQQQWQLPKPLRKLPSLQAWKRACRS
mmetsp:Transcript_71945/g.127145  ORF Transcript_71945/g.127145 Transcript_71945/m.127145 type:complete len:236 (+) Transcript_71945:875-1582(+)